MDRLPTAKERLAELFNKPDETMDIILNHVASGGSLTELCKLYNVPYHRIRYWIKDDPVREKEFAEAHQWRNEWYVETLFAELRKIAASDLREIMGEDGRIKDPSEWPESIASVVSSFEVVEEFEGSGRNKTKVGYCKKIKLWNKEKAIEMLGKHLRLFVDRVDVSGKVTLEDLVGGSYSNKDD